MQPAPLKTLFFESKNIISRAWQNWFNLVAQSGYVDRGDPSANDFTQASLTTDGTWRDLDLSSIIPLGATLVHIYVRINDDATGSELRFRENGNSNTYNRATVETVALNQDHKADLWVKPDKNGVIEYFGSDVTFTNIDIVIRGWFI